MIWNKEQIARFLEEVAKHSDDPDTRVSCFAVRDDELLAAAPNRLPRGIAATAERLSRPAKYSTIIHAERNLIARCAALGVPLAGATLYMNWRPCVECAQMIIQADFASIACEYGREDTRESETRYGFHMAKELLEEAGVKIEWF